MKLYKSYTKSFALQKKNDVVLGDYETATAPRIYCALEVESLVAGLLLRISEDSLNFWIGTESRTNFFLTFEYH